MVTQTSLNSYFQLQQENKLNSNQTIIMDVFKREPNQPRSIFDLSMILGWSEHRITGRLMELRQQGRIVFAEYKVQRATNRKVKTWKLNEVY